MSKARFKDATPARVATMACELDRRLRAFAALWSAAARLGPHSEASIVDHTGAMGAAVAGLRTNTDDKEFVRMVAGGVKALTGRVGA